ncbi:MAG: hypothetical protein JNM70_22660 [Anaerolineae bacterium]|nr:hypothetical protein [Anaerolineae bacterium]
MVYDRARYFSPALGQFPSLDPLEVFNRYAYVNGNPVMRRDPSGMVILMCDSSKNLRRSARLQRQPGHQLGIREDRASRRIGREALFATGASQKFIARR